MKKSVAIAMCVTFAMASSLLAADTVTSVNVVGYYNVEIKGDPSVDVASVISVPLTKLPSSRGKILSNTLSSITAVSPGWQNSQFMMGITGEEATGASTFYIEITTGAFEGRHFYIADNTADSVDLAVSLSDVSVNELADQEFKVVAANRVRDVLGEPGGVILKGGAAVTEADQVHFFDPVREAWSGAAFYMEGNLFGGTNNDHWVTSEGIVDDAVIDRDEAIKVNRLAGGATISFVSAGEVSANDQAVVLDVGANLVGGMVAADSTLVTSDLLGAVVTGASVGEADNVHFWDPVEGRWGGAVFYMEGNIFGGSNNNHWVSSDGVADDAILAAGGGYRINTLQPTIWLRTSPLK